MTTVGPILIRAGYPYAWQVIVKDPTTGDPDDETTWEPKDLTDWTVLSQIRRTPEHCDVLATWTAGGDRTAGEVLLSLSGAQTELLPSGGDLSTDVRLVNPGGVPVPAVGNVVVRVTRETSRP